MPQSVRALKAAFELRAEKRAEAERMMEEFADGVCEDRFLLCACDEEEAEQEVVDYCGTIDASFCDNCGLRCCDGCISSWSSGSFCPACEVDGPERYV